MGEPYKRLPFEQYFIDTSDDFGKTGKARFKIKYKSIEYEYEKEKFTVNYCVRYDEQTKAIEVHFEKTTGLWDWVANFMFCEAYYDSFDYKGQPLTLYVHNGWAARYKAIKHQIRDEVGALLSNYGYDTPVVIIGWSLGSGQACLAAQDLNYNLKIKPYLYTYGSVNPFYVKRKDKNRTIEYLNSCCTEIYNFVNVNDIVGYQPPNVFGFVKPHEIKIRDERFNPIKLFNPKKYHTEYWKSEIYQGIE